MNEIEDRLAKTLDEIERLTEKPRYSWPPLIASACIGVASVGLAVGLLTALTPQGLAVNRPPYLHGALITIAVAVARSIGGTRAGWISAGLGGVSAFLVIHASSIGMEIEWALAMFAMAGSVAGVRADNDWRSASPRPSQSATDKCADRPRSFLRDCPPSWALTRAS